MHPFRQIECVHDGAGVGLLVVDGVEGGAVGERCRRGGQWES